MLNFSCLFFLKNISHRLPCLDRQAANRMTGKETESMVRHWSCPGFSPGYDYWISENSSPEFESGDEEVIVFRFCRRGSIRCR